jgi:GH15 family glucan-1,4-alpha-glucosidase
VHNNRKELAIQEDETAIVVFMLGEYLKYSDDQVFVDNMYDSFVKPAADFMTRFVDEETGLPHASYDLWEEKFLSNTYTAAITYRALLTAVQMATHLERIEDVDRWQATADLLLVNSKTYFNHDRKAFIKGFLVNTDGTKVDSTLDISSFYGSFMFEYYAEFSNVEDTLSLIEEILLDKSPSGGSPRYENDYYFRSEPEYMGNPWFVTTLWMAQYYARNGQKDKALKYIDWALNNSLRSGLLSEQINPVDSRIVGVTPLVWSHAELISTILDTK